MTLSKLTTILLAAILISSCAFIREHPHAQLAEAQNAEPYDAIIVPGNPYEGETWTTTMNYRVHWSVYLYKSGITNNIIFSSGSVYSEFVEAKIMQEYAIALGVPAEHIFLDTNAEHSTENVYYSYKVAQKEGFEKLALATDPFQNSALKRFLKKHQLPMDQLPIVFDMLGPPSSFEPEIDNTTAINSSFVSIKEREGFFKRLVGTRGKNIFWHESDLPNEDLISHYEKKGKLIRSSFGFQDKDSTVFSSFKGLQ